MKNFIILVIAIVLVVALTIIGVGEIPEQEPVLRTGNQGGDISHWQGQLNFASLRDDNGFEFVIVKIGQFIHDETSGTNWKEDVRAKEYLRDAVEAGLKVGFYIYSQATTTAEAEAEADKAIEYIVWIEEVLGTKPFVVAIDMEDNELNYVDNISNIAITFCHKIERNGYNAALYSNVYWLENKHQPLVLKDQNINIWLAKWIMDPDDESIMYANPYELNVIIWQFGITRTSQGEIDVNKITKDIW